MPLYNGSCHCGGVTFSFEHESIDNGLKCNCSICKRKGAVMSAFTLSPKEIEIKSKDNALSTYEFDTKVAKHYFCKVCGIYPFHKTLIEPGNYRVNLGCVENIDTNFIQMNIHNGKDA